MRIVLLGNAGAGKTTMARRLIGDSGIPHLSLDEIAWDEGTTRKPLAVSLAALHEFIQCHDRWVIEGCYGELAAAALPHCTELRFLNPGVRACVAHCRSRPWEPEKFASIEAQQAMLEPLVQWVREYEGRQDDCGLAFHRCLFDDFDGPKREYTTVAAY